MHINTMSVTENRRWWQACSKIKAKGIGVPEARQTGTLWARNPRFHTGDRLLHSTVLLPFRQPETSSRRLARAGVSRIKLLDFMFKVHYQSSSAPGLILSNMRTLFCSNPAVTCQRLAGQGAASLTTQIYQELEKKYRLGKWFIGKLLASTKTWVQIPRIYIKSWAHKPSSWWWDRRQSQTDSRELAGQWETCLKQWKC